VYCEHLTLASHAQTAGHETASSACSTMVPPRSAAPWWPQCDCRSLEHQQAMMPGAARISSSAYYCLEEALERRLQARARAAVWLVHGGLHPGARLCIITVSSPLTLLCPSMAFVGSTRVRRGSRRATSLTKKLRPRGRATRLRPRASPRALRRTGQAQAQRAAGQSPPFGACLASRARVLRVNVRRRGRRITCSAGFGFYE
jgi:hypothetical protein